MNARILSLYPNCSLGGMTTVYRNRAQANSGQKHTLLFQRDLSGRSAYTGLPNTDIRIVNQSRFSNFVKYSTSILAFDEVRITSLPELPASVHRQKGCSVVYEFHTSDESIIERELTLLDFQHIDFIQVPSLYLSSVVAGMLPEELRGLVRVTPNLVDTSIFSAARSVSSLEGFAGVKPIVWIGRFDKGKNPRDFLRMLSLLPEEYVGVLIVSFETQPERTSDILAEAAQYGLQDRVSILLNISQTDIANLYGFAAENGGVLCSTSLGESFGYSVAEARSAGLATVAYDVGAISERDSDPSRLRLVPVGDIHGLVSSVLELTADR